MVCTRVMLTGLIFPAKMRHFVCGYVARNVNVSEGQHTVYHEMDSAKMSVSMYGFKRYNGYGYYAIGDLKLDYSPSQSPTPTPSTTTTPTLIGKNNYTQNYDWPLRIYMFVWWFTDQ